jgi:hypothetical protein
MGDGLGCLQVSAVHRQTSTKRGTPAGLVFAYCFLIRILSTSNKEILISAASSDGLVGSGVPPRPRAAREGRERRPNQNSALPRCFAPIRYLRLVAARTTQRG